MSGLPHQARYCFSSPTIVDYFALARGGQNQSLRGTAHESMDHRKSPLPQLHIAGSRFSCRNNDPAPFLAGK